MLIIYYYYYYCCYYYDILVALQKTLDVISSIFQFLTLRLMT